MATGKDDARTGGTGKAKVEVTQVDFKKSARFEGIATLEAYWHAVRGNRLVPPT